MIEATRINLLRLAFAAVFLFALMLDPLMLDSVAGRVIRTVGILAIFAGVLGRFWAILYIGGRKTMEVVDQGPYSLCRHPLYLFSTVATLGFGLMVQSLTFAVIVTLVTYVVLYLTAASEERRLKEIFGPEYADYARRTPRVLPRLSAFQSDPTIEVNVAVLRRNYADALVFLALIPVAEVINWWNQTGILSLIQLF